MKTTQIIAIVAKAHEVNVLPIEKSDKKSLLEGLLAEIPQAVMETDKVSKEIAHRIISKLIVDNTETVKNESTRRTTRKAPAKTKETPKRSTASKKP